MLMVKAVTATTPLPPEMEKQIEEGLTTAGKQLEQADARGFARMVMLEVIRNTPVKTETPDEYANRVFQYTDAILQRFG
jgi:hypothetical protein